MAEPNLRLPDFSSVEPGRIGEILVGHFLDLWEGGSGMPILLRSAASNEAAANGLKQIFASQVLPAIAVAGSPRNSARIAPGLSHPSCSGWH